MNSTRLLPTLALLLITLGACDDEPLAADLDDAELTELERRLELQHGVELELVTDLDYSADDAGTSIVWTEVSEVLPDPAAGTCGWGHWEFDHRHQECGSCEVFGEDGEYVEHYERWCWDGPPSCGGCGGWQYTGWGCAAYLCD